MSIRDDHDRRCVGVRVTEAVCEELRSWIDRLERGAVNPNELVITNRVSKKKEDNTQSTRSVAALERAADLGLTRAPGQSVSYLVVDDSKKSRERVLLAGEELVDWIIENWVRSDEIRSNLITSPTVTQILRGEYPWHPVVGDRWEENATAVRGCPVDAKNTSLDLLWEAEYDCSIGETYGIYTPSPPITGLLDLEWVVGSKEFVQSSGTVGVADVSKSEGLHEGVDSTSMLGASSGFVDELRGQGYSIVWVVQGEKRVITSGMAGNKMGQTQTRAVFTMNEEGEIVGESESDFYNWG